MRICYLAWHGSVHTRRWARWFAERGHEVHVVTCGGGSERDDESPLPYTVHELGEPRAGKFGYLLRRGAARRIVRRIAPDVLHAHWVTSYGMLALSCDRARLPLVVTAHGDDVLIAPRSRLLRPLVQRVLRAAQLVTVPSETMREAVQELIGPAPEPVAGIHVFQYGVATRRLAGVGERARAGARPADEPLRIVSARAMLDLYRIDVVLDALARLVADGLRVHLDLLGDGPCRADLEERARRLGVGAHCQFHGAVDAATVEHFIAESDVYVSVAESDGVSLALLEALALGAVPVLSDIPANRPWITDRVSGMLVDVDAANVARGIQAARALDRSVVARVNLECVQRCADRDTNLARCELLIDSLMGVTWDANPVDRHSSRAA